MMPEPLRDATCERCELFLSCKTVCIPGDGPLDAEVLVLGIAPGGKEDELGRPFLGQSGQLLRSVVLENKLIVRYTNVARCRPPENRDPTAEEQRACAIYLESELLAMPNLKYVVALGSLPMKAMGVVGSVYDLAGVPRRGGVRGVLDSDGPVREFTVIPVMHPAGVLRRQTYLSTWESHWHQIRNLVNPPKDSFSDRVGAKIYPNGLEGKDWRTL